MLGTHVVSLTVHTFFKINTCESLCFIASFWSFRKEILIKDFRDGCK